MQYLVRIDYELVSWKKKQTKPSFACLRTTRVDNLYLQILENAIWVLLVISQMVPFCVIKLWTHFTVTTEVSWRWSTYLQFVIATREKDPRFKFAATAHSSAVKCCFCLRKSLRLFPPQNIEKLFLILWMCFRCNTQSSACPDIQTHMKRLYFHRLEDPNVSPRMYPISI